MQPSILERRSFDGNHGEAGPLRNAPEGARGFSAIIRLFPAQDGQFPPVAVGIVEPEAHVP